MGNPQKTPVSNIYESVIHYISNPKTDMLYSLLRICKTELENEKNALKMAYEEGNYDGGSTEPIFNDSDDYFTKSYEDLTENI